MDLNFNPTGLPVVNEKITITVAGSKHTNDKIDFNDKYMIKWLEEQTNVHAEWEMSPLGGWLEKRPNPC